MALIFYDFCIVSVFSAEAPQVRLRLEVRRAARPATTTASVSASSVTLIAAVAATVTVVVAVAVLVAVLLVVWTSVLIEGVDSRRPMSEIPVAPAHLALVVLPLLQNSGSRKR
jgi:hypothetical protein